MKQIKYFILALVAVFMVSCNSCDNKKDVEPTYFNLESVIQEDLSTVSDMFDTFYFYESSVEFANGIDSMDKPQIIKVENVFQHKDTCVLIMRTFDTLVLNKYIEDHCVNLINVTTDTLDKVYKCTIMVNDYWMEDCPIVYDSVNVKFDSAWVCLKNSGMELPSGKFMTMRRPLQPPFDTFPSYIFGSKHTFFLRVCGNDGTVTEW